jgi:hypothetical protein
MNQPFFFTEETMQMLKAVNLALQEAAHDPPQDDVLSDDEPTADGSRVYAKEFDE